MAAGYSKVEELPPQHQVFINFRGLDLRNGFVSHLVKALEDNVINVIIGHHEDRGQPIEILLERIKESRIALVIFSGKYTESRWCVRELAMIKDCMDKGTLVVIPIFYKVFTSTVRCLEGEFGDAFRTMAKNDERKKKWEEALMEISSIMGIVLNEESHQSKVIKTTVNEVLKIIPSKGYSKVEELPPQHQVFINFHGLDLRNGFVSHLVQALEDNMINFFIDIHEGRGRPIEILLERIKASRVALVIFSPKYTESRWCMRELAMIKDCMDKGTLKVIPIFYKVHPSTVRYLKGGFGDAFRATAKGDERKKKWKEAFMAISSIMGIVLGEKSDQSKVIKKTDEDVRKLLKNFPLEGSQIASVETTENSNSPNSSLYYSNERKVVKTTVKGVRKLLEKIPSEGSQIPPENSDFPTSSSPQKDTTFGIKQCLKELGDKLDLNNIRNQAGMIIGCLLLLFFCLQHIAYMSTPLTGEGRAIHRIVENVPKVLEYIPADQTDKYGAKPPNIQVFINFRGDQLRKYFISYLAEALRKSGINIFIDTKANIGDDLINLFKRIEGSGIAIVVFSSRYTESEWCLNELVKIKERAHQGLLKVLPIFYKVTPGSVKRLKGEFGDNFRDKEYMYASDEPKIKRWKEAIVFVSHKFAMTFDEKSVVEIDFIETIVKEVLKMLQAISTTESGQSSR